MITQGGREPRFRNESHELGSIDHVFEVLLKWSVLEADQNAGNRVMKRELRISIKSQEHYYSNMHPYPERKIVKRVGKLFMAAN
jgi:hypothetical protein